MKKLLLSILIISLIVWVNVWAGVISIGVVPIDRAASFAPLTMVNKHGAANATGVITEVRLWAKSTLEGCEVATFYVVSGNNLSTRDNEYIGQVVYGAVRTFEVTLNVQAGDYIGCWFTDGALERDYTGFDGIWYTGGDNIPCTDYTFTFLDGDVLSLSGTGITVPDQVLNVQATDGDHTDKVVVTWNYTDGATKYYVWNGADWIDVGNVLTWNHTGAPAPTITHGSITASDGTSTAHVALSNTGASANNGSSITYYVKAWNAAGYGAQSAGNSGYRGVGSLTYQWYRSAADSDASYSVIGGATSSTHNDTAAPAGSVPGTPTGLAATDGVHTDKVALTWSNVSGGVGAGRYYKCYHTATGATPGYTGVNRGYRKAYTSTNTQVKRDTTELGAIGSLATSYNDTGADAPTITVGTASASDGTSSEYVTLSIAGESTTVGTTHDYYVRTYNTAGWGNYCTTNTGYRGVGSLTYQWQRSAADSDADYSNIDGGTTDPYNDTGAPEDGSGRYFKCVENATGAAQVTTNADRGYRLPAGITWNGVTIIKWNNITVGDINTQ